MLDAKFMSHVLSNNTYDAVIDGTLTKNNVSKMIYVESEDDLDLLTDEVPGTFAATYGYTNLWQLGSDGEWVAIIEEA